MKNIWKYLTAFLGGAVVTLLIAFRWTLNKVNVTNADTVIESLSQEIKKLKQKGTGNVADLTNTVNTAGTEQTEIKSKKELRKEKRAEKKAHNNNNQKSEQ